MQETLIFTQSTKDKNMTQNKTATCKQKKDLLHGKTLLHKIHLTRFLLESKHLTINRYYPKHKIDSFSNPALLGETSDSVFQSSSSEVRSAYSVQNPETCQ